MKILFAPSNIASFSSTLSSNLNLIAEVKAKGFSLGRNKYVTYPKEWKVIQYIPWKSNPVKRLLQEIYVTYKLSSLIIWADILFWQWQIKGLTLFNIHYWIIKFLKKPIIVEWVGSEVRQPGIVMKYNVYYKKVWESGEYEYKYESEVESLKNQSTFKKLNAIPVVSPEVSLFINRDYFKNIIILNSRVDLKNIQCFTQISKGKIVIVHTPSALGAKGTQYIRQAISCLNKKGLNFEYREITNVTREESLKAISQADIFLDQFILGSYGMAACEAMAMGKTVICYLMPPVVELLPKDCPIINANPDDLAEKIEQLILNPNYIFQTGLKSRQYVEKYHDAEIVSKQVLDLCYKTLKVKSEETS